MDLSKILRFYVDKMLKEIPGMKVLVMDNDTTQAVSMVYSQSEILEQEVFLVEKLEAHSGERLLHLKARPEGFDGRLRQISLQVAQIVPINLQGFLQYFMSCVSHRCAGNTFQILQAVYFLRPTRENVARLRRELRDPRFGEYNLCELLIITQDSHDLASEPNSAYTAIDDHT